jgi:hypothetical protein
MAKYWCSFANAKKPAGQQFLGVCIVVPEPQDELFALNKIIQIRAEIYPHLIRALVIATITPEDICFASATAKCHRLKINPGGEVQITALPDDYPVLATDMDRLLNRQDMQRLNAKHTLED